MRYDPEIEKPEAEIENSGSLAVRLSLARSAAQLTQEELAERAGIPGGAAAISHYESGRREPSLVNLRRLIWALGESADYLLATRRGTDDPYRPKGWVDVMVEVELSGATATAATVCAREPSGRLSVATFEGDEVEAHALGHIRNLTSGPPAPDKPTE